MVNKMTYPQTPGYVSGSDTSQAAADSIDAKTARGLVLAYIQRCGLQGATSDETEATLGMRHQTCSARFTELAKCGDILDSGQRRKTRSKRNAVVWIHFAALHSIHDATPMRTIFERALYRID